MDIGIVEMTLFVVVLILLWFFTLLNLRTRKLYGTALAIWTLIICAVPIVGALAYWIVQPVGENK